MCLDELYVHMHSEDTWLPMYLMEHGLSFEHCSYQYRGHTKRQGDASSTCGDHTHFLEPEQSNEIMFRLLRIFLGKQNAKTPSSTFEKQTPLGGNGGRDVDVRQSQGGKFNPSEGVKAVEESSPLGDQGGNDTRDEGQNLAHTVSQAQESEVTCRTSDNLVKFAPPGMSLDKGSGTASRLPMRPGGGNEGAYLQYKNAVSLEIYPKFAHVRPLCCKIPRFWFVHVRQDLCRRSCQA